MMRIFTPSFHIHHRDSLGVFLFLFMKTGFWGITSGSKPLSLSLLHLAVSPGFHSSVFIVECPEIPEVRQFFHSHESFTELLTLRGSSLFRRPSLPGREEDDSVLFFLVATTTSKVRSLENGWFLQQYSLKNVIRRTW